MKGRPKVVPFLFGYIQNSIYIYVMNIYQFSWTDMSGGFDHEVNIEASTELKAKEIFINEVGKTRWRKITIDEWPKHLYYANLNEIYTEKHINSMRLNIHFHE